VGRKRKPPKKSSCFTRLSRTKNLLACLSCNSDDSPAYAKAFFSALRKKGWDAAGFQETELAVFFRYHHRRRFAVYISLYL
jgi:hypothetical protein